MYNKNFCYLQITSLLISSRNCLSVLWPQVAWSTSSDIYNLYFDVQRADDVVVVLPAKAGEKHFSPEQKVKLINPRITTDGYKIGERGFVNYILLADDIVLKNKNSMVIVYPIYTILLTIRLTE